LNETKRLKKSRPNAAISQTKELSQTGFNVQERINCSTFLVPTLQPIFRETILESTEIKSR